MSQPPSSLPSKVMDANQLAEALGTNPAAAENLIREQVEALIAPTADDLLALTSAAVADIDGTLPLTQAQRDALSDALRKRLLGAVLPAAVSGDGVP